MENFNLLGSLALQLHQEFVRIYYVILPIFFALAIAIDWIKNPGGTPDFLGTLKRAFIATLLVAGFQEISEAILAFTSAIADKISDMSGLDEFIKMVGEKCGSYPRSGTSIILGFNDMVVALLSFGSYVILYIARYITVALYHFMWIFLSILSPLLIALNLFRGTQTVTINLFKSMIEVASWKIVWAVLSVMITTLSLGNAFAADGNYLTVILLNFVIALAMLGTPLVVKSLVGSGLSSMGESLGMGAAVAMAAAPARAVGALSFAREVLSDTQGFTQHMGSKMWEGVQNPNPPPPLVPPGTPAITPESHQLPAPPVYAPAPDGYHGDSTSLKK
jgi:hypothetical protein